MKRHSSIGTLLIVALGLALSACGAPQGPGNGGEPAVLSVSIDQGDISMRVGQTRTLTATVQATGGASTDVLWGSDAPAIAAVDGAGVVTAVAAGEATITATSVFDSSRSDSITVEVGEADVDVTAQGETRFPTPRTTFTVGGGETMVVAVDFPSAAADLMYMEIEPSSAGGGLRIELRGLTGDTLEAVSRSPSIFAESLSALPLTVTQAAIERSSLSVQWQCFGPCVARPYRSGTSYVHVVNEGSVARSVTFYAYGFIAADENEANDTFGTATVVDVEAVDQTVAGAIEHTADRDYFRFDCAAGFPFATVRLELNSTFEGAIELVADGNTYAPGEETLLLPCGTTAFVHTSDGTAGPSSDSGYTVTIR